METGSGDPRCRCFWSFELGTLVGSDSGSARKGDLEIPEQDVGSGETRGYSVKREERRPALQAGGLPADDADVADGMQEDDVSFGGFAHLSTASRER